MLKSIFGKTLYEKRLTMLFWFLGVMAMTMVTMSFYSTFKSGSFDEVLKNLPKNVQALTGNLGGVKTMPGFIAQQIYSLRAPLLSLTMAITMFTSLIAGDEADGTLQTLLAQPVSRSKVFFQKYLAGAVVALVVCSGSVAGVFTVLLITHRSTDVPYLFAALIDLWLIVMVYGTIGFAAGAITGKRSVAGGVASLAAFGTYLLTSLLPSVESLKSIEKFMPWHYYNNPGTAQHGLNFLHVAVLITISLVLLTVSSIRFNERDIYQK